MKKVLYLLVVAIVAMVTFVGCGGKDDAPDFRDDYVGTYEGTSTEEIRYFDDEDSGEWISDSDDFSLIVVVKKNGSNSNALDFYTIDSDNTEWRWFTATQLQKVSNGLAFKIENQSDEEYPEEQLKGLGTYSIDNKMFDGGFSANTVTFGFQYIYPDDEEGEYEKHKFEGSKK